MPKSEERTLEQIQGIQGTQRIKEQLPHARHDAGRHEHKRQRAGRQRQVRDADADPQARACQGTQRCDESPQARAVQLRQRPRDLLRQQTGRKDIVKLFLLFAANKIDTSARRSRRPRTARRGTQTLKASPSRGAEFLDTSSY